jgi:hypothetical protein
LNFGKIQVGFALETQILLRAEFVKESREPWAYFKNGSPSSSLCQRIFYENMELR